MPSNIMLIYIKNLRGDKTELQIEDSERVLAIKEKLLALQGHAVDLQKLILAGKILEDGKTAAESGITEGATLVLMVSKPKAPAKVPAPPVAAAPVVPPVPAPVLPQVPPLPAGSPAVDAGSVRANESPEGPSALVTGEALSSMIEMIVSMGFDRKDVEAAMKAAYNNPDRAIEYLTTGLPEPPRASAASNPSEQQFRQLMQDPQFLQLVQVVQQNPAALQHIMQQLQQNNPDLYNLILSNRETFMQMLQEPPPQQHIDPGLIGRLPRPPQGSVVQINLSQQEQEQVKRLVELGFARRDALEAYLICEKNEEMAANLLFENYQPAGAVPEMDPGLDREEEEAP
jgi:UV excision repair protein RAD23